MLVTALLGTPEPLESLGLSRWSLQPKSNHTLSPLPILPETSLSSTLLTLMLRSNNYTRMLKTFAEHLKTSIPLTSPWGIFTHPVKNEH